MDCAAYSTACWQPVLEARDAATRCAPKMAVLHAAMLLLLPVACAAQKPEKPPHLVFVLAE